MQSQDRSEISRKGAILKILEDHVGKSCAIRSKDLQQKLFSDYSIIISNYGLRKLIGELRDSYHCICSTTYNGYYIPVSIEDVKETQLSMMSRVKVIAKRARDLKIAWGFMEDEKLGKQLLLNLKGDQSE